MSAKIVICFLSVLFALCVCGTILDNCNPEVNDKKRVAVKESFIRKLVKAFSLSTNYAKLFEGSAAADAQNFVNGIKVLMTLIIIFEHTCAMFTLWKERHYRNFYRLFILVPPAARIMDNALQLINIFFILIGYYLVRTLWSQLDRTGGKINVMKTILQRYLRFTPVMLFTILISFGAPVLFSGPVWNSTWEHELEKCRKYGWLNILFIQNLFLKFDEMCWLQLWFLAACLQLLVVSVPLVLLVYRNPKCGIGLGLLMFFGCVIYDYYASISNKFPFITSATMRDKRLGLNFAFTIYGLPTHHFGSQLFGMILGYMVLQKKENKFSKTTQTCGWILSLVFFLGVIHVVDYPTKDIRIIAMYYATRNIFWNIGCCWFLYACFTGSAGCLGRILSNKLFIPFARVTHWSYLLNPVVVTFFHASMRERMYFSKFDFVQLTFAHIFFTFLTAFIAFFIMEAPLNNLKDLFSKENFTGNSKISSDEGTEHLKVNDETSFRKAKVSEKEL